MTTETQKPRNENLAFYIFEEDADGQSKIVGNGYRHRKGKGFNLVMKDTRYVAFPPKAKS